MDKFLKRAVQPPDSLTTSASDTAKALKRRENTEKTTFNMDLLGVVVKRLQIHIAYFVENNLLIKQWFRANLLGI